MNVINAGASPNDLIGTKYGGGLIFYITANGSGLVAATTNFNGTEINLNVSVANIRSFLISSVWGCDGVDISGADGTAIGTGKQNTLDIASHCSTSNAASACLSLDVNGFSDWFLPSKDELNEVYEAIGPGASNPFLNFQTQYSNVRYWTSSEINGADKAWSQELVLGSQPAMFKTRYRSILPIREF